MTAFPDFYIVGAAKCGTTSLWNYLRDHPEVHFGPVKEPNYFAFGPAGPDVIGPADADELRRRLHGDTVTDEAAYLGLYADAAGGQRTGEASVRYLYYADAAQRIASVRPDARIVIVLRDPIERLRSHYAMNRAWDLEPLELPAALDAEDERIAAGWGWDWHYVRLGLYATQVERYLRTFGPDRVLVLGHDDLRTDPTGFVQRVCTHIGVDPGYVADTGQRSKEAYVPRSRAIDALRRPDGPLRPIADFIPAGLARRAGAALRRLNHQPVGLLDEPRRNALARRFDADLAHLEELLGRPQPWQLVA